jgi:hypothetical protein
VKEKGSESGERPEVPVLVFSPEEEALDWLKGCYVGYLHHPREASLVQTGFFMEGFKGIRVANIGR